MSVAIIVPRVSNRLTYVLDWIFGRQLGIDYTILTQEPDAGAFSHVISYGVKTSAAAYNIPDSGLLFEQGITVKHIEQEQWKGLPVFFANSSGEYDLPFDLLAAVFYLISRYEEYLPFVPDKHDRYPATDSLLYKMDCLNRPLVDEWLAAWQQDLQHWGITARTRKYHYLPTYDIDIAWSYRHKGFRRNAGGYLKSLATGNIKAIRERTNVLRGITPDPFDSFDFMASLHKGQEQRPYYFILAGLSNTAFDKQILPGQEAMTALIRQLATQNHIGTHPSYFTAGNPAKALAEKEALEQITGSAIHASRQHYIKMRLPDSCRQLRSLGITEDYSMGYGTHLGFRAGTSQPFPWYDLEQEQATELMVVPFCFMDATAHYELGLTAEAAFERLHAMAGILQKVNGTLVTVFHNFSLGTDPEWPGWREQYALWIQEQSLL